MTKPPKKITSRTNPSPDVTKAIERTLGTALDGKVGKPEIKQAAVSVARLTATRTVTQYMGPLPHPEHLQSYENTLPGAADRILKMAEYDLEHSSVLEKRGMSFGAVLSALLVLCAFGSLFITTNPYVPAIFLTPAVIVGINTLIRGRKPNINRPS